MKGTICDCLEEKNLNAIQKENNNSNFISRRKMSKMIFRNKMIYEILIMNMIPK